MDTSIADRHVNLAQSRLGARVVFATDEFFAPAERLLDAEPAVFIPGKFDDHGKWMDGWETRRKRVEGHDWCIVRLGVAGVIRGVDIDTSHFTGNYPPAASLEACNCPDDPDAATPWTRLIPPTSLNGNSHHLMAVHDDRSWTHVRLSIYPDGGIARLRVYGEPSCNWAGQDPAQEVDLIAMRNGGRIIACNDRHFGAPENLLAPGRGVNMGDGWETRRRREPGHDWVIIALGHPGFIRRVEVDTAHFKGNYPDRCSLQGVLVQGGTDESLVPQSMFWPELLPASKLEMDRIHVFDLPHSDGAPVSHVRFNIHPDGGVSRLRLFGHPVR